MSKKYIGNFLGIVVQNSDPEKRGRVKVYVPHIAAAVYTNWNKDFADVADKAFVFPDAATNPDLDNILPYLKKVLPWAEQASPLFGGSATGRYNAFTKKGSTSDSTYWKNDQLQPGFRPIQNYVGENRLTDAFTDKNPNTSQYTPSDYSNLARGEFTIPNVGAHVWVFFIEGDANYPVVFAASHGQEDWKRIYSQQKETEEASNFTSADYPASYENLSSDESTSKQLNHNTKTFRAKTVFNSNKHTIELVDTDLAEILKFTHFSGSFLEFNNATTTRLATNNDQTMVIGDQYLTVRKNQSIYVANYQETTINGDRILHLGNFTDRAKLVAQILDINRDTHNHKLLFELQRANTNEFTSSIQARTGTFAACPVCSGSGQKLGSSCITCAGSGKSPSTQWGNWKEEPLKKGTTLIDKIRANQKQITDLQYEALFGNGGDDQQFITGNQIITIGTVLNDLQSFRVDPIGKIRAAGTYVAQGGTYVSMAACPLVEYVDVDSLPGGDLDMVVGNKYRINVGSKGIHMKTTGPLDIYGSIVNFYGEAIYVSARQELLINGGAHVEIRAGIICLTPQSEVFISGGLGVAGNVKVIGSMHVEGELGYLHQTAPKEQYVTDVGYGPVAHTHNFYGPPWTLLDKCGDVRTAMDKVNYVAPSPNEKCYGFWVPG